MARFAVADGVRVIACTPHFLPGVYNNSGPDVRPGSIGFKTSLSKREIECHLVSGGDVHIDRDLVAKLKGGEILSLNNTRYVLVEPPHHVLPPNIDGLFFSLLLEGYVPIITHPERMSWIGRDYEVLVRLVRAGAWTQITAGSSVRAFRFKGKELYFAVAWGWLGSHRGLRRTWRAATSARLGRGLSCIDSLGGR